jgi:FRG domain
MRNIQITAGADLRVDEEELRKSLQQRFPDRLPSQLTLEIVVPEYVELYEHIRCQSTRSNKRVAADQSRALMAAQKQMSASALWGGRIIVELSKRYGYRAAAQSCSKFLAHRFVDTVVSLGRYQLDDGTARGFGVSMLTDIGSSAPARALHVYREEELLEIIVRDPESNNYTRIYVPPDSVDNTDSHQLFANLQDDVLSIPLDVWLEYVVPQCVAEQASGIAGYLRWAPDRGFFSSEGLVWSRSETGVSAEPRFVEPPHLIGISSARSDGADARAILHCYQEPPAIQLGPHVFFPPGMDLTALTDQSSNLRTVVQKIDDRTWKAPTVWHAVAWLVNLVGWDRKARPVQNFSEDSDLRTMAPGALLFRGQADRNWDLVPRLHRDDSVANRRALARFVFAMMYLQRQADSTSQTYQAELATAQHYGLPTALLDFTLDPRIAGFFAVDSDDPNLGSEAAIYWMPLQTVCDLGGIVVLAPYWVERIYRQKGCFIDYEPLNADSPKDIKSRCFSIRFPRDSRYRSTDIAGIREGILPESEWFERAVQWARKAKIYLDTPEGGKDGHIVPEAYANDLVKYAGPPEFNIGSMDPNMALKRIDLVIEVIRWLALTLENDGKKFTFQMDCSVIAQLAQDNPGVFTAMRLAGSAARSGDLAQYELSSDPTGVRSLLRSVLECLNEP